MTPKLKQTIMEEISNLKNRHNIINKEIDKHYRILHNFEECVKKYITEAQIYSECPYDNYENYKFYDEICVKNVQYFLIVLKALKATNKELTNLTNKRYALNNLINFLQEESQKNDS